MDRFLKSILGVCFLTFIVAFGGQSAHGQSYPGSYRCSGAPAGGTISNPSGPLTGAENDMWSTSSGYALICSYYNFPLTGTGCYALTTNLNVDNVGGTTKMIVSYTSSGGTDNTFTIAPDQTYTLLLPGNTDPSTVNVKFTTNLGVAPGGEAGIYIYSVTLAPSTGCSSPPPGCTTPA